MMALLVSWLFIILGLSYGDYICNSNQDCVLNCTNTNQICSSTTIDASLASSLSLYCQDVSSCEYSTILCPYNDQSTCNIKCIGEYSCSSSFIHSNYSSDLNIECSNYRSCLFTTIHGPKSSINVDCNTDNACGQVAFHLNNTSNITVLCRHIDPTDSALACSTSDFYVNHANYVEFLFEGDIVSGYRGSIGNIIYGEN